MAADLDILKQVLDAEPTWTASHAELELERIKNAPRYRIPCPAKVAAAPPYNIAQALLKAKATKRGYAVESEVWALRRMGLVAMGRTPFVGVFGMKVRKVLAELLQ